MARRVFFSFHYENDVTRAAIVRNSNITQEKAGFVDGVDWEAVKRGGDPAIERWIDNQLDGTSVTVVLIGSQTNQRHYVQSEVRKSWHKDNGILGIRIHNLKNLQGQINVPGGVGFGFNFKHKDGSVKTFDQSFYIYDWVNDDGYNNLEKWIETAAQQVGR